MSKASAALFADIKDAMQQYLDNLPVKETSVQLHQSFVDKGSALLTRLGVWAGYNRAQAVRAMRGQARPDNNEGGALGHLIQKRAATIDLSLPDAVNRKWKPDVLVRNAFRNWAYQSAIIAQIDASGSELFEITYPLQPGHEHSGKVFSTVPSNKYPTFDEINSTVFHPNASAWPVPYVQT